MTALHLTGPLLVGPEEEVGQAWVLDGRLTFTRPQGETTRVDGWVLPGLVDAHCHIGLGTHGEVDRAESEAQALTERAAGALLLRDAGSPADTRWVQERDDLPVLVRAGRHVARTRRYLRNFAEEVEPEALADEVRRQARRGDGWVKLVGDWIDRDTGDLAPCWPADALAAAMQAAHAEGARVTAHCFAESSLAPLVEAGIDCVEHATGLTAETIPLFAERGVAIVPTLVNIATFPQIAAPAEEKFPAYAAHMKDLHARRHATVGDAHDAGVADLHRHRRRRLAGPRPDRRRGPRARQGGALPGRGPGRGDLVGAGVAGPPGADGGGPGRPRGPRPGPAHGPLRAEGPPRGGAPRAAVPPGVGPAATAPRAAAAAPSTGPGTSSGRRRRRCRAAAPRRRARSGPPRGRRGGPRPTRLPRRWWVRPTATWARPCQSSRSPGGACFHAASSTS